MFADVCFNSLNARGQCIPQNHKSRCQVQVRLWPACALSMLNHKSSSDQIVIQWLCALPALQARLRLRFGQGPFDDLTPLWFGSQVLMVLVLSICSSKYHDVSKCIMLYRITNKVCHHREHAGDYDRLSGALVKEKQQHECTVQFSRGVWVID